MRNVSPRVPTRPIPPSHVLESDWTTLCPAPEVLSWVRYTFRTDGFPLYNEDHAHLESADLQFLWASTGYSKQGRTVLGQCEQVMIRAGGWQKARQEQQMREWFGRVPDFLITLDADYSHKCSDAEFCALVEHELYHIGHLNDEYGAPAFYRDSGLPKLGMRAHDVEEFVGVVRRYGAGQDVQRLIDAAKAAPEVTKINIARACGTCLLRAA